MMFRLSTRFSEIHSQKKVVKILSKKCSQSSHSKVFGGASKKALLATAGITAGGIGLIGYSAWNDANRKTIEHLIPGSSSILYAILGPLKEPISKSAPKTDEGLLKKKLDRDIVKQDKIPIDNVNAAEADKAKTPVETGKIIKDETEKKKVVDKVTDSENAEEKGSVLKELPASNIDIEKNEIKENTLLTELLEETITSAQKQVTDALTAAETAAVVIRQHVEKAYTAIDSGQEDESLYAAAAETAQVKKELIKSAEEKLELAKRKIEDLQKKIETGYDSKYTKENKSLAVAEEALSELKYAISKINSTVVEALRDSSALSEFKDLVHASRKQFESEVRSLMPEVKLGEKSEKLTTDELNLLLAHAHRKVIALQRVLAKQQTLDKERYKSSIIHQREKNDEVLEKRVQVELEKQRRELGLEHRHRLSQLKEEMELELRTQLKRQTAAHSDHLADMLTMQERELERKWESQLHEKVHAEAQKYHQALSQIQGSLYGLKAAIKSRADIDRAALSAHELWVACEALRTSIRLGKADAHRWEEKLLSLPKLISSISQAAGNGDPFVDTVLSGIAEEALTRGVYTEEALRERFMKVNRICRRVAFIGENGGSLLKYFLSYLQSFILLSAFEQIPEKELQDENIDTSLLNTYEILCRVKYCLNKDSLLQAVRYMNLLSGEPRNVASDWLKEARLTLEAKQVAEALMSYAAATSTRAV